MGGLMARSNWDCAAAGALLLSLVLSGCGQSSQRPQGGLPPPAVTVATPTKRTVVDRDEYVGRFVPVDSVEIRARVSGYLESVHFTDGQMVRKGDVLFTIDRRPFAIALDQARANLSQARANLAFTETDLARATQLVRDRTITEQAFDQRTQAKRVAESSVKAFEAVVHNAELDYAEFSELRAPVDGRIGDRRVSPGNLVTGGTGGNTTLLGTIMSIDPIRFEFTVDEGAYLRFEQFASRGSGESSRGAGTPVKVKLLNESDFAHDGEVDFVDNAISASSGTIRGRAVFANPTGLFTPGMFGRIQVPGSAPYEALLVPDVAIGTEQARKFVYVVDAENKARQKYLQLGQLTDGLRVVKTGLAADDRVIVSGLTLIRPGVPVVPQEQAPPPTPTASGNSLSKAN
jgi:membrane fusion protein, multidrug efflux system